MKCEDYPEYFLETLKSSINCSSCPPKRNCCSNFSERFLYELNESSAGIIFEGKVLEFHERGFLTYDVKKERFIFTGGRCPQLTEENKCAIHYQKEKLGLGGCIDFPISLIELKGKENSNETVFNGIKVNYTCFYIENNWEKFYEKLIPISITNLIRIYYNKNEEFKSDFLNKFDELLKNGEIPEQSL